MNRWSIIDVAIGIVVVAAIAVVFAMFVHMFEIQECDNWRAYEAQALGAGLKSESWQKEQCKAHGIYLTY